MFCTQCGTQLKDGTIFCTKCGNKIGNIPTNSINDAMVTKVSNSNAIIRKNSKSIAIVLVVLLVLIVAIIGIHNYDNNSNSLTIDDVKNGVLYGYEDETIGEAFEDYFYNCSWDSFIAKDGDNSIDVVEFTGYIYDYNYDMAKVLVQFIHDNSIDTTNDFEIYCIKIGDDDFTDCNWDILSTVYSDGDCSFMHRNIFTDFE